MVWIDELHRPCTHKTAYRGHTREIYPGPKAQQVLVSFLKDDPEAYVFSPREAVAERRAALVEDFHPEAEKIVLVVDNLNTRSPAPLYEAFAPEHA